jgi:hypothetical protein
VANRMLGIGAETNGPAILRPATDETRRLISRGKLLLGGTAKTAMEAGEAFCAAKDLCPHGEWQKLLRDEGLAERTVRWAMKKHRERHPDPIAVLLAEDKPPKGGKREPGDDRPKPVVTIERAMATIEKAAHEIVRCHDVPDSASDAALVNYRAALGQIMAFADAPERPFKAPYLTKCKDCHVEIQMTQTSKHGWIPLMAGPDGGDWEIVGNAATKVPFNRSDKALYEMHRCPARKKT